jgi:hypothetical protein
LLGLGCQCNGYPGESSYSVLKARNSIIYLRRSIPVYPASGVRVR